MILFFILSDQGLQITGIKLNHDIDIGVILHNLQYLYLMILQSPTITVNKIPKEIQQFRFIVALITLALNIDADVLNQLKNYRLVIEHSLIIVIHLL